MVKAEKRRKSSRRRIESGSEDEEQKTSSQLGVGNVIDDDDDDDDAEANEDLSLKIVEKAMLRKCSESSCSDFGDGNVADLGDDYEIVTYLADYESEEKEMKAKRRKVDAKKGKKVEAKLDSASSEKDAKNENFCSDLFQVDVVKEEGNVESEKALQVDDEAVRTNPVEVADSLVLRKLLRGPRYFDPPDSSWSTCYNCGEEGHMAVSCTLAKRKKPCFLCGSLEHPSRSCPKGKEKHFCYFCIQGGHRARDCPEKSKRWKTSKFCLKCGDSGHDMFSCGNNYFSDDLKLIQCYVCGSFGHLCCVDYAGTFPRKVTCYRCGLSGHTGLACKGSREETPNKASSCYKCGELGHFSRECTNAAKAWKGSHKQTPKKVSASKCYKCGQPGHFSRDCSNSVKVSANSCYHCGEQGHFSHDCTYSAKVFISGNKASASSRYHCGEQGHFSRDCTYSARKSGKRNGELRTSKHRTSKHDERWMKASKSKQKLGWTTEDPGEAFRWSSPKTPSGKRFRTSSDRRWLGGSGGTWSSWSSRDC